MAIIATLSLRDAGAYRRDKQRRGHRDLLAYRHRYSGTVSRSTRCSLTFAIAVPAGLAFSLPMSTPANAIAVSSHYITVKDLVRSGVIMSVTAWVVFNLVARFYWPSYRTMGEVIDMKSILLVLSTYEDSREGDRFCRN